MLILQILFIVTKKTQFELNLNFDINNKLDVSEQLAIKDLISRFPSMFATSEYNISNHL